MNLSFEEVINVLGGAVSGDGEIPDTQITAIVKDNRDAVPGCLFAAIVGEHNDGHNYINAAAEAGAVCVLGQRVPEGCRLPVILVNDTVAALGTLSEYYRKKFDIPIVGVTGSVGKTTAKEMLSCVLSQRFPLHKTPGNLNNEIGTPLTLFGLEEEHKFAVVEMGISNFTEMYRLGKMVHPQMAYYSSIGYAHLEFLGDLDGVLKAKTEMLEFLMEDGAVFVNGDDKTLRKLSCPQRVIRFGLSEGCDVTAENIEFFGGEGMALTVVSGKRRFGARINSFGLHLVSAALGAAAVGMYMGLTDEEIARGIAAYSPVGGRSALEKTPCLTIINDCYNANPTSVESALDSLARLGGRHVAILGDMMELGERYTVKLHEMTGARATESGLDLLLTTGEFSENTHKAALEAGIGSARHFRTKPELIAALPELLRAGDCVLVKASNSKKFDEIVEALRKLTLS